MSDTGVRPSRGAVQGNLDALQAERDATWPEDRLIAHAALRRSLEDRADRAGFIAVGDALPSFVLDVADADGDGGGIVRYVDVHPDWMVRTGAATVIDQVERLGA